MKTKEEIEKEIMDLMSYNFYEKPVSFYDVNEIETDDLHELIRCLIASIAQSMALMYKEIEKVKSEANK